jgi:putative exporter of polyketide antibiotics
MLTKKAIKLQKDFLFGLFGCKSPRAIETLLNSADEDQLDLLLSLIGAAINGSVAVPHTARRLFQNASDIAHLREQFESSTNLERTLSLKKPVKLALLLHRTNLILPTLSTILQ